jgi:hypothetical protein
MAIYGLAYVSISEMRDSKIAAILGEEQVFTGEWEFLWTANNKLSKNIDLKCKTFKTLSGASRSAKILSRNREGKAVRLQTPFYSGEGWNKKWINSVTITSATHKLVPIEITDSWNKLIDDMIESKRRDFEGEVKRLKEKKDETKTKSVLDMV